VLTLFQGFVEVRHKDLTMAHLFLAWGLWLK